VHGLLLPRVVRTLSAWRYAGALRMRELVIRFQTASCPLGGGR
jgi:hypothetical protein